MNPRCRAEGPVAPWDSIANVRTLLLLRHAKSSWDDVGLSDHDRPLAPRGERAAKRVGTRLYAAGTRPELVLCSSARRARQTLERLGPAVEGAEVRIEHDLYGAGPEDILALLRHVADDVSCVLVVGHNPGIEELAFDLAGDGDEGAMAQLRTKYPTAALAVLDLGDRPWAKLAAGGAYLSAFALPGRSGRRRR